MASIETTNNTFKNNRVHMKVGKKNNHFEFTFTLT